MQGAHGSRRALPFLLPIMCLLVVPISPHAQPPRGLAVRSSGGGNAVQALEDLVGDSRIRIREAALQAQQTHAPQKAKAHRTRTSTGTISLTAVHSGVHEAALPLAKHTDGILPGLPDALVAVVEGAGPSAGIGSIPSQVPSSRAAPQTPAGQFLSEPAAPVALTARVLRNSDPNESGLFMTFESGVGAAAFSRGHDVFIVFNAARPLDLSAVQDDPFAKESSIQLLPEATVLRLRARQPDQLRVRRLPAVRRGRAARRSR